MILKKIKPQTKRKLICKTTSKSDKKVNKFFVSSTRLK